MSRVVWRGALLLLLTLGLTGGYAVAKDHGRGGNWRGDHRDRFERHESRWQNRDHRRGDWGRERDRHEWREARERRERWERWREKDRRERWERSRWAREHDRRPPGWDHGRKTGWSNCDVPPGQARRNGCGDFDWLHRSRHYPTGVYRRYPQPQPVLIGHRPQPVSPIVTRPVTPIAQPAPNPRGRWWNPRSGTTDAPQHVRAVQ